MESALKWLASNCPQEAPVYCNYLPCFFKTCFFDDFWYRVHHTLSDKSVFTMKQVCNIFSIKYEYVVMITVINYSLIFN